MTAYFRDLAQSFGSGWNRFWFAPSDAATLSFVRALVGALVFYTVATYTPDLDELFGARAILTIDDARQLGQPYAWSYFFYLREPAELRVVHAVGLVVIGLFTLGLFARVTCLLSLVAFLSYLHRNPLVTSEFEPVLAMALSYLWIGRCGDYFSLDAWLRKRRAAKANVAAVDPSSWTTTVSSRLLQIHLAALFALMVTAKLRGEVWWNGDAVWWLLSKPESRLVDLTRALAEHPYVYQAWTYAIVLYEITFPVLIWNRLARPLLLAAGLVLWPLLAVITGLVTFAASMLAVTCIFIPPPSLRAAAARLGLRA